jgi:hypothetical protein
LRGGVSRCSGFPLFKVFRCSGFPLFRCPAVQVFRFSGFPASQVFPLFRFSAVQVFRCSGFPPFRFPAVQVSRRSGFPLYRVFRDARIPGIADKSAVPGIQVHWRERGSAGFGVTSEDAPVPYSLVRPARPVRSGCSWPWSVSTAASHLAAGPPSSELPASSSRKASDSRATSSVRGSLGC